MILNRYDMLIPVGHPNRKGIKADVIKFLIVHFTANDNLGATDIANAKYFARAYKTISGVNYESNGTTKFRVGATNKVIDEDSVATVIPVGEYAPNAGDRQLDYNNGYKGQTALAASVNHRQNWMSISYELCNNDNWQATVDNAVEELARDIVLYDLEKNDVQIKRHYDFSGKICPRAFVKDTAAWNTFVDRVWDRVKEIRAILEGNTVEQGKSVDLEALKAELQAKIQEVLDEYKDKVHGITGESVTIEKAIEDGLISQAEVTHQEYKVVNCSNLNFRSEPSSAKGSATIVAKMPVGSACFSAGETSSDKKWQKCYYKDLIGWAYLSYLQKV